MDVRGIFFDFDETLVGTDVSTVAAYEHVKEFLNAASKTKNSTTVEMALGIYTQDIIGNYKKGLSSTPNEAYKVESPTEIRTRLWESAIRNSLPNDHLKLVSNKEVTSLAAELYEKWNETRLKQMKMLEPVTEDVLYALRKNHILILITNGSSIVQWDKIKQMEMEKFFDHVIVSGDEPHDKPHVSIFQKACSLCNLRPEQCAMVGDSIDTDILGANTTGLAASVLFKSDCGEACSTSLSEGVEPNFLKIPTHTITSIAQLPAIFCSL